MDLGFEVTHLKKASVKPHRNAFKLVCFGAQISLTNLAKIANLVIRQSK